MRSAGVCACDDSLLCLCTFPSLQPFRADNKLTFSAFRLYRALHAPNCALRAQLRVSVCPQLVAVSVSSHDERSCTGDLSSPPPCLSCHRPTPHCLTSLRNISRTFIPRHSGLERAGRHNARRIMPSARSASRHYSGTASSCAARAYSGSREGRQKEAPAVVVAVVGTYLPVTGIPIHHGSQKAREKRMRGGTASGAASRFHFTLARAWPSARRANNAACHSCGNWCNFHVT